MAQNGKDPNIGWTLVGWINFVAILLVVVLLTGTRLTAAHILGGTAVFVIIFIFLMWTALRRR
jgi:hypothetical protein